MRIVTIEGVSHPGYLYTFLSTPYGQPQIKSKIYGAVVDELTFEDSETILIPNAPFDIQERIGNKVLEAFELKDQAAKIELGTTEYLENELINLSANN